MKSESEKKEQTTRVIRISDIFINEYQIWEGTYNEIEKGYNFLAGDQYTEKQISYFNKKRRPVNVFNMIFPIFNQILGDFFLGDERMKVFPKGGGDPRVADALESVFDTVSLNTEAKEAFGETLLAGLNRMGVVYPRFSDELEIDGSVVIQNVDEFEIMYDHRARKRFADDAGYLIRSRWLNKEQILRAWSNHRGELTGILDNKDDYLGSSDASEEMTRNWSHRFFTQMHQKEEQYRIVEFHEKVYEDNEVLLNVETGETEILTLTDKKRDIFLKLHPEMDVVERNVETKKVTEIIPALNFHLDRRDAELQDGKWDPIVYHPYNYGKVTHRGFGLMKNAMGPQKHFNDLQNTKLDILNKQSSSGWDIIPDEMENYEDFLAHGHEPGFTRLWKKNTQIEQVIKERKAPGIPAGHQALSEEALDFLFKVTNAHFNFMGGSQTANENASLFAQRVRQASKNLVVADFNFRACKRRVYEKVTRLVQQNISMEKLVLFYGTDFIKDSNPAEQFMLADKILNDPILDEYKIGVDDLERNPTAKATRFMEKMELVDFIAIKLGLGPAAIDFEWLLSDSDVGDIDQLKVQIEKVLQGMGQEKDQAEAVEMTNSILEMANKKQGLEDAGGLTASPGGSGPVRATQAVNT